MFRENLSIIGFFLIILTICGGVVYNWGFGDGSNQSASVIANFLNNQRVTKPPTKPIINKVLDSNSPEIFSASVIEGSLGTFVYLKGKNFGTTTNIFIDGKKTRLTDLKNSMSSTTIVFPRPISKNKIPLRIFLNNKFGTSTEFRIAR